MTLKILTLGSRDSSSVTFKYLSPNVGKSFKAISINWAGASNSIEAKLIKNFKNK